MESDFPLSSSEAEAHIRQLRRDRGLGDGPELVGNNAADLSSALALLSDDLYQTPTHFLLELIQNADDNSYDDECPTLSISYAPGKIQVDCNERGFSRKNVEAICRICHSTKSGRSKRAGFVGEKGIGFKAVFKAASQVWISSGHYSFRFDRDAPLGMIAPIWDPEFPGTPKQGCTSMFLKLAKDCDEKLIVKQLKSFDEKMLLFLRRLRRLEIDARPSKLSLAKPFRTVVTSDGPISASSAHVALTNNGVKKHYFMWRHTVTKMPKESRRPDISSSEIVLAFPHTGLHRGATVKPIITSQSLYAFLPIEESGFPFLLQGDFLLSASREDVHLDSPWNKALKKAAIAAFVDAARAMGNFDNALRYTWIRYVPTADAKTSFLFGWQLHLIDALRATKLLIAQNGQKRLGSTLFAIPAAWCDDAGNSFVNHQSYHRTLLAPQYNKEKDWDALYSLGVELMSEKAFNDELAKMLKSNPEAFFKSKDKDWHSSFARVLVKMARANTSKLPIVPLRGGSWSPSFGSGLIFMSTKSLHRDIPDGVELNIVDIEAAADPARAALYAYLGIRELEMADIRNAVKSTHIGILADAKTLSPKVLVAHAEFLFKTWDIKKDKEPFAICMAAREGPRRASDKMYFNADDTPGSASRTLPKSAESQSSSYGFLHPAYHAAGGKNKAAWLEYLHTQHGVETYTRIFDSSFKPRGAALSSYMHSDFRLMIEEIPSRTWLCVLRDGWDFYKQWLNVESTAPHDIHLLKTLRLTDVQRTGNLGAAKLQATYLPLPRLTKVYGKIGPFVDVPEPDDPRWPEVMRVLKVGMQEDITFFVNCLSGAKEVDSADSETIRNVMHEIEDRLDGPPTYQSSWVKTVFETERLICVPTNAQKSGKSSGTRKWVAPSDCYWRGESWLAQSLGLQRIFPDLETLFRTHCNIPNAGIDHLIREAKTISTKMQPSLGYLERLFLALSNQVRIHGLDDSQRDKLKGLWMFPVAGEGSKLYLVSATSKQTWMIADRVHFRTHFQGSVPMLAFDAEYVMKIIPFLHALGLRERCLSVAASSITGAQGDVKMHKALTQRYRLRSKYLFRLMPVDQPDEKDLREKFRNMHVYTSSKIVQYWRAPVGLQQAESTESEGAVFLECDSAGGDLRVYLREGYEEEMYPFELAEQLHNFFGVPAEHRDLLTLAMIAPEERVDELFEARGILPLLDGLDESDEDAEQEEASEGDEQGAFGHSPTVLFQAGPSKRPAATRPTSDSSRFSRLFSNTRFRPSSRSSQPGGGDAPPPSYSMAVSRAAQTAIGRPSEPRAFSGAVPLSSLRRMDFVQRQGEVVGTSRTTAAAAAAAKPQSGIFDLLRSVGAASQREQDIGETIVSDILAGVLGTQYNRAYMFTPRETRKPHQAAFTFVDTQGSFGALLMRLDGMSGKAQGYTRLVYHLDVKVSSSSSSSSGAAQTFKITQAELDRAREHSVHNQPDPDERAPSKHVSVLVHVSDLRGSNGGRGEPSIRFLPDPWDLFEDGQLVLENMGEYVARLNLRTLQPPGQRDRDVGFDAVQVVPDGEGKGKGMGG